MKGVKVCLTCVRVYKKAKEMQVAPQFVDELKESGMPSHGEESLLEIGSARWQKENIDSIEYYAAEIINDNSDSII